MNLLREIMQAPHCYDDTFDEAPADREACIPLLLLHEVATEMDKLGVAPDGAATWADLWPGQTKLVA